MFDKDKNLISSRLDYCNSLLYGSSQANIHKLQRVQNVIAKLVCASNARSSDFMLWQTHGQNKKNNTIANLQ